MIYDRELKAYTLSEADSPLDRRLSLASTHYYAEKEVYHKRFWESVEAGDRIDIMVELPRAEINADMYCVPEDGETYRVLQSQHGRDNDGLPITTLSLHREEKRYDFVGP